MTIHRILNLKLEGWKWETSTGLAIALNTFLQFCKSVIGLVHSIFHKTLKFPVVEWIRKRSDSILNIPGTMNPELKETIIDTQEIVRRFCTWAIFQLLRIITFKFVYVNRGAFQQGILACTLRQLFCILFPTVFQMIKEFITCNCSKATHIHERAVNFKVVAVLRWIIEWNKYNIPNCWFSKIMSNW